MSGVQGVREGCYLGVAFGEHGVEEGLLHALGGVVGGQ